MTLKVDTPQQFFLAEIEVQDLQEQVQEELDHADEEGPSFHYTFADLDSIHVVEPHELVRICDAVLQDELDNRALTLIADVLTQSEKYEWDDERVTEVLYFWLEPEDNYALDSVENIQSFKRWLTGEEELPV